MKREKIDEETLAAFLDDRLAPEERTRVIEHLASDEDALDLVVEAAELRADLEALERRHARAVRPRLHRAGTVWVLLAAGVAAVLLVPRLDRMGGNGQAVVVGSVETLGAAVGSVPASALAAAFENPGWTVLRGVEGEGAPEVTAFRAGARTLQLQVAVSRGDVDVASSLAAELTDLLGRLAGAAPVAAAYAGVERRLEEGDLAAARSAAAAALAATAELLPEPSIALGAWVGASRLALDARRAAYFEDEAVRRGLAALLEARPEPALAESLSTLSNAIADGVQPEEWPVMEALLAELAAQAGG